MGMGSNAGTAETSRQGNLNTGFRNSSDLKVWIDCSFASALQRAIVRAQEGLSPAETKRAFETIYFPAQRLHLEHDKPREHADVIFDNEGHVARRR